jgi:hypothetical protein
MHIYGTLLHYNTHSVVITLNERRELRTYCVTTGCDWHLGDNLFTADAVADHLRATAYDPRPCPMCGRLN